MLDFAAARRMMVDGQIRPADITDPRLVAAMLELPRERFLPQDLAALAYLDLDLPVSEAPPRRLLPPMVLARLLQSAQVAEGDRILDVGCATGYSTALLARLGGTVIGLEQDEALARAAAAALQAAALPNARVVTGPLPAGWPAEGPYDLIALQGAVEFVPPALIGQLKDGGRLVCVLGGGRAARAMLYRRQDGDFSGRAVFDAAAPALPGFARPPAFVF